jgi:hypothetical protein
MLSQERLENYKLFKDLWEEKFKLELSDRLRVKFYRAKKIYKKIMDRIKNSYWLEGFFEGAELDSETRSIIYYFYTGLYFDLLMVVSLDDTSKVVVSK